MRYLQAQRTLGATQRRRRCAGHLLLAATLLCACEDETVDTAEIQATKAECHQLMKHIVGISSAGKDRDPDAVARALPIEDIQGCVAAEPEMRGCMLAAKDVTGVKACIPPDDVLACMHAVAAAKKANHEKAKASSSPSDPTLDATLDGLRAQCWAGDAKAAERLKRI